MAWETGELECGRGGWNSACSSEMRRDAEEHRWRRQPPWADTDAQARKRGEQTGLDTLVVHALNDVDWVLGERSLGTVANA